MKKERPKDKGRDNCTMAACPMSRPVCQGCGFDKKELKRRRELPLVLDERTGLRRKHVGREGKGA